MSGPVLLDTHTWVWAMFEPHRLGPGALSAMEAADLIAVSVVSVYEVAQKVRLGKWQDLAAPLEMLVQRSLDLHLRFDPLPHAVAARAGLLDWPHRDPFDRIIAATALDTGSGLVTRDTVFSTIPTLKCIW